MTTLLYREKKAVKIHKLQMLVLATFVVVSSCFSALNVPTAHAATANLLTNGGLETASSASASTPDSWYTDNWGSLAATFDYTTDAHSGTKAVKTTVSNYANGDAKWFNAGAQVTASTSYHYTDWYKSNTATYLWAQYTTTSGAFQYAYLGSASSSQVWTEKSLDFVVPASVQRVSIFHVVASNGWLTLDDASLSAAAVCTTSRLGGLNNGGFEDVCPSNTTGAPAGWQVAQYGTSSATFNKYASTAHSGSYAASATNVDGEAGFATTIDQAVAGQRYSLSFWQNTTTYTYAYITYKLQDGSVSYQSLMSTPATMGEWSLYKDSFLAPVGLVSMQVTIATSGVGTIVIDDVSLVKLSNTTPTDFSTAMISLTFDDGTKSAYQNGFPLLKQYGYKGTFYVNGRNLNTTGFMTSTQLKTLAANGQEIGSHMYTHDDIVSMSAADLDAGLADNTAALRSILGPSYDVKAFASPYGSYTSGRVDRVLRYATSHRTTDGTLNTKANLDARQIHARLVTASTTPATMQSWVNQAAASHAWLVLVYHNIASSAYGQSSDVAPYNVTPANFKKQLDIIKASGIPVQSVTPALTLLSAQ